MLTNWNDDIDDPTPDNEQPISAEFCVFALGVISAIAFCVALIGCVWMAFKAGFCG